MTDLWDGSPREVAARLIGAEMTTHFPEGSATVVITEAEAYGGADDPASHAWRGRTVRNGSMFERPGTIYVYKSYGIHWCVNMVTGEVDDPSAVLIRSGVPGSNRPLMARRRNRQDHLCDGPGKLAAALGIDGTIDGLHVSSAPHIDLSLPLTPAAVRWEPRVGVSRAADRLWRAVQA